MGHASVFSEVEHNMGSEKFRNAQGSISNITTSCCIVSTNQRSTFLAFSLVEVTEQRNLVGRDRFLYTEIRKWATPFNSFKKLKLKYEDLCKIKM